MELYKAGYVKPAGEVYLSTPCCGQRTIISAQQTARRQLPPYLSASRGLWPQAASQESTRITH
ncbi:hypothetical protein BJX62DRAFT_220173, partial [Aspergillus germanicus]